MKLIKEFETVVNLSAEETYGPIDQVVMNKLREMHKGRCNGNSLILEITGIIMRSTPRVSKFSSNGSTMLSVKFSAETIVLKPREILANCEIQHMEKNNHFLCLHKYAVVYVNGNRDMYSLKEHQKISVQIIDAMYPKGENKITVIGSLYGIDPPPPVIYEIIGSDKPTSLKMIEDLSVEIEKVETALKDANKKIVVKINESYYPFKNKKTVDGLVDFTARIEPGNLVSRPDGIDRSERKMLLVSSGTSHAKTDAATARFEMMWDYYNYIRNLQETAELFTDQMFSEYGNLWTIYDRLKRKN